MQGYYFSCPLPEEQFVEFLRNPAAAHGNARCGCEDANAMPGIEVQARA
jgi:hypothetical protein